MRHFGIILFICLIGIGTHAQDNNLDSRTLLASLVERLNVRSLPNEEGEIITVIERGTIYEIVARNAERTWWLIDVGGAQGWVMGSLVAINNPELVPLYGLPEQAIFYETITLNPVWARIAPYTAGFVANTNLRISPTNRANPIGTVIGGEQATVIGRTQFATWLQVEYGGVTGWVDARYVELPPNFTYDQVPVRR